MTRYLLDTNHFSAVLRGEPDLEHRIHAAPDDSFGVSVPSIGELWFMVYNSRRVESNAQQLREAIRRCERWDFDLRAAQEFGRIRTELRKHGRPIPPVDAQIAAVARANDLVVLTGDRHFSVVSDLTVENWLSP